LSPIRPDDLAALTLDALMERTGVPPEEIEDVFMGCANQAGEDNRNLARMALLLAGFPEGVGGTTINRLCGSGLDAVANAARVIMLGEAHACVGAGVESMSRAPWAVLKPEHPFPSGDALMQDTTLGWRFVNPEMEKMGHTDSLGETAENLVEERYAATSGEERPEDLAEEYEISRERQDRFALSSHQKAVEATDEKRMREEIFPVPVKTRTSEKLVEADEVPRRDTSLEKLGNLKPAFKEDGTVTAGNSSPLNDGAAAALLVSGEFARAYGLEPMAKIRSMAVAGVSPRVMGIGPVPATKGFGAGRALTGRHRPRGTKRGLRRAGARGASRVGDGPGGRAFEPERRCHRPRSSHRLLRDPYPDHPFARDGTQARGPVRSGDHVHRRRAGHRHGRGEGGVTGLHRGKRRRQDDHGADRFSDRF
jgi:acetyl-CoA acetyltransferase family protein